MRIQHSLDGQSWQPFADLSQEVRDRPNAYLESPEPILARYVKYEHLYVGSPNLAISDIRVFGHGAAEAPAKPQRIKVRRDADAGNAFVSWEAAVSPMSETISIP